MPSATVNPAKETAFRNQHVQMLALRWRDFNERGVHTEAMKILEEIILESTKMFTMLAQYQRYQYTVDLDVLVSSAQEKVVVWLQKWNPKKGPIFTYFSVCAKHAFLSEIGKVNQFRQRCHVTGDNLEKFFGAESHDVDKVDAAAEARKKIENITCRWGDVQEIGAIHFLLECIIEPDHDRQSAIRSAAYAWGISFDFSKFFYSWALAALRDAMYQQIRIPFTEQDLFRLRESYSDLCNFLDMPNTPMNWEHVKWIMATHGGKRIKIPTLAQMARLKQEKQIFDEIDSGDKDPDSVAAVAKKYKKSTKAAQEIFTEMVEMQNPKRSGEYEVYSNHID